MATLALSVWLILSPLLTHLVSSQLTHCPPNASKQLKFVAQLSVSGCVLFVHDTAAAKGPHLAVEPVMCVTEGLHGSLPRYDPVTQQTYVSVPVKLRDEEMLTEAKRQLQYLSRVRNTEIPKSVKFAQVSDISVSTDASSAIQALGFDWTPDDAVGILRLGCRTVSNNCSVDELANQLKRNQLSILESVLLTVNITTDCLSAQFNYRPIIQNQDLFDSSVGGQAHLPSCPQLRFLQSVRIDDCTARVYRRLDMKGHFLIEPLLCHNPTSLSSESVMFDYSRNMYYLKLDVVLHDDRTADVVKIRLAEHSPISVAFMRVWRVQRHVTSALSNCFKVGQLMVSRDGTSGQVRMYCKDEDECKILRRSVIENPFRLWRHARWTLSSLVVNSSCGVVSPAPIYLSAFSLNVAYARDRYYDKRSWWGSVCESFSFRFPRTNVCGIKTLPGSRHFVVIQQRITGRLSFQQNWIAYEKGFGLDEEFWLGLSAIHSLSLNGATLRIEMKLWSGAEVHAEYADFKVGDASTNYRMSYSQMLLDRSSLSFDALKVHQGMQFSTMDKDNDAGPYGSCSVLWGKGGWWFNDCYKFNPNGLYPSGQTAEQNYACWHEGLRVLSIREVRLMLQI